MINIRSVCVQRSRCSGKPHQLCPQYTIAKDTTKSQCIASTYVIYLDDGSSLATTSARHREVKNMLSNTVKNNAFGVWAYGGQATLVRRRPRSWHQYSSITRGRQFSFLSFSKENGLGRVVGTLPTPYLSRWTWKSHIQSGGSCCPTVCKMRSRHHSDRILPCYSLCAPAVT